MADSREFTDEELRQHDELLLANAFDTLADDIDAHIYGLDADVIADAIRQQARVYKDAASIPDDMLESRS